jgi:hypothetical protein
VFILFAIIRIVRKIEFEKSIKRALSDELETLNSIRGRNRCSRRSSYTISSSGSRPSSSRGLSNTYPKSSFKQLNALSELKSSYEHNFLNDLNKSEELHLSVNNFAYSNNCLKLDDEDDKLPRDSFA